MRPPRSLLRAWTPALCLLAWWLAAPPAFAQATASAEAGLNRYYKAQHWIPVQVALTNQGAPAKVEVRGRFATGMAGAQESRLPERTLQSGANQVHTLYMRAPASYATQPLVVELLRDG